MKSTHLLLLSGLLFLSPSFLLSQGTPTPKQEGTQVQLERESRRALIAARTGEDEKKENRKDPGYATYKKGYDAILDEKWEEAIKQFHILKSQYPGSEYRDDAQYWRAYAFSHLDRKKGIIAYKVFLEQNPRSRYVDDAVADLGNLDPTVVVNIASAPNAKNSASAGHSIELTAPSPEFVAAESRRAAMGMRVLQNELRVRTFTVPRPLRGWTTMSGFGLSASEDSLDPSTQVKLDAIYAIGSEGEDEQSFQTLKEIATDRSQHSRLRQAAILVLADFKKFDAVPLFVDLAKTDTSEMIQTLAIQGIGSASKDKNKSVDALIALFNGIPPRRSENRNIVLISIADIGNDRAVDFLTGVAKSNSDYDLRRNAVYYLGSIGGEKARTALYQILKSK
jgi:HEAT repeat protein